jgi:hypothetical protein
MRGPKHTRIEAFMDHGAASAFGAAVAWISFRLLAVLPEHRTAVALASGAVAYALAALLLRRFVAAAPSFAVPCFEVADLQFEQVEELVLTDEDRLRPTPTRSADELVLDDILAELEPDSRVVRLFDPARMPTPGQLKSRIDRHLEGGTPLQASPDASQALYDALAELRRSLR